jgi:hypothetical protein
MRGSVEMNPHPSLRDPFSRKREKGSCKLF